MEIQSPFILLVDDDSYVLNTISQLLEAKGYRVLIAGSAAEALRLLDNQSNGIGVVVTDVKMPDMDGVTLLERINTLKAGLPVILMTAYADLDMAVAGIRGHAFDFIAKPRDLAKLAHSVAKAMEFYRLRCLESNYKQMLVEEVQAKTLELLEHQEQLSALATELSQSEERQRRLIAAELHDSIGQTLAFTKIRLSSLANTSLSQGQEAVLREIRESIDRAIQEIRTLTFQISPPLLYEVGLEAALESLAESFSEQHRITVKFQASRVFLPLEDDVRNALFQAVRELLVNAAKHASANQIKISIELVDTMVKVVVADDGTGFEPEILKDGKKQRGFGLFNIRQRLERLGGSVEVEARSGAGCRVTILAPLKINGKGCRL